MTLDQIKEGSPFPWTYVTLPPTGGSKFARVVVTDARGQEVPMFTLLDFSTMCSRKMVGLPASA